MTKYEDLMKQLRKEDYAPAYLLCGDEPYYIDLVSQYIEQNVLKDEGARMMDQVVIYGKDLQGDDIAPAIAQARGYAMMGGKQVVIVKEAQTIKKWEALGFYMEHPQPSSLLVICYKFGSPDKRASVWKNFESNGGVMMVSDKLRDYQLPNWIQKYIDTYIKDNGLNISVAPQVAPLLAEYIGSDLLGLIKAIDKLILGMPDGQKTIDTALVERNLGISKDYNVFELQSALIAGDVLKANRIIKYFTASKTHPIQKELGVLYSFFANLMLYHYLPDKTDRVAAPILGVAPFFVKDYALAAKRYTAGKTMRIIGYFRDTDAKMKGLNGVNHEDDDLWKELIYKILH